VMLGMFLLVLALSAGVLLLQRSWLGRLR
jgi:hypothetical protein